MVSEVLEIKTEQEVVRIPINDYDEAVAQKIIFPKGKHNNYSVQYPIQVTSYCLCVHDRKFMERVCLYLLGKRQFILVKRGAEMAVYGQWEKQQRDMREIIPAKRKDE